MAEGVRLFSEGSGIASKETIRKFVKDLKDITEDVKTARDDRNKAIKDNKEIEDLTEEIKKTQAIRKEKIKEDPIIQGYEAALQDVLEERRQLISDAKQDGVPRDEIDLAIKALKKDIDISLSTEIYANIADLIDID